MRACGILALLLAVLFLEAFASRRTRVRGVTLPVVAQALHEQGPIARIELGRLRDTIPLHMAVHLARGTETGAGRYMRTYGPVH